MAFNTTEKTVVELVIAAYGRVLAQSGITFYSNLLDTNKKTEDEIRDEMMSNTEAGLRYPTANSNDDTVTTVFNNVLGRIPAQTGIDFYSNRLDANLTVSELVKEVLADAKKNSGADKDQLDNKIAISQYYLDKVAANPTLTITAPDLTAIDDSSSSLTSLQSSIDTTLQYQRNTEVANSHNSYEEVTLNSAENLYFRAKEISIAVVNGILSDDEKATYQEEVDFIMEDLVGLANTQNESGDYIFSGGRTDTEAVQQATDGKYYYYGDNVQRKLAVDDGQQIADGDLASGIFFGTP